MNAKAIEAYVSKLEKERDSLRWLAGNMLATLELKQNKDAIPDTLHKLTPIWRRQYEAATSGAAQAVPPYSLKEKAPC